jgi:hypothetical protein
MTRQLVEVIKGYTEFKIIIKSEIFRQIILPKVTIINEFNAQNINQFVKSYPEIEEEVKKLEKIKKGEKHEVFHRKYLRKMFVDRKFSEILEIIKPDRIIKSCFIIIKGENIDCRENIFRVSHNGIRDYYLMNTLLVNFNASHRKLLMSKGVENNLDKIVIKWMKFGLYLASLDPDETIFVGDKKSENQIYYSSHSIEKLGNSRFECQKTEDKELIFNTNDFDECRNDCFLSFINKTYKCLDFALLNRDFNIDIDKHLSRMGYKICSTRIPVNKTFETETRELCRDKCSECLQLHYCVNLVQKQFSDKSYNSNKIEIIPENSPHVKYIETLQTDINQLIYNLGGIIGLWFGLSPKQIPDLFINVTHSSKALLISFYKLFIYLLSFFSIIKRIICRYRHNFRNITFKN